MSCRGHCSQGHRTCPHPVQCQDGPISAKLTDWGVLDNGKHQEPENLDLPPMTREERGIAWLIAAVLVVFIAFLLVGCGGGEPEDYFEPAVPPVQMSPAPPLPSQPTAKPMPTNQDERTV